MPCVWAVVQKLVLQDVDTNFVIGERTAPRGRRQEKRRHLEVAVQGTLQVGPLLGSDVAVLEENLSVSQDFIAKELPAGPHINDVRIPLFFHRRERFTSAVGQAISMMGDEQVEHAVMRDADLGNVLDQLFYADDARRTVRQTSGA